MARFKHEQKRLKLANPEQDQPADLKPILKPEALRRYKGNNSIRSQHLEYGEITKFNNTLIAIISIMLIYIMFIFVKDEENMHKQQCTTMLIDIEDLVQQLITFICEQYCKIADESAHFFDIPKPMLPLYKQCCSVPSIKTIANTAIKNRPDCNLRCQNPS